VSRDDGIAVALGDALLGCGAIFRTAAFVLADSAHAVATVRAEGRSGARHALTVGIGFVAADADQPGAAIEVIGDDGVAVALGDALFGSGAVLRASADVLAESALTVAAVRAE